MRRILKAGGLPEFQAVDYSTLDVRQLGSIYEGLLEYKVVVAEEEMVTISQKGGRNLGTAGAKGKAKTFADRRQPGDLYLTTDKGERKATGSYYTPDYIVEYIVENTLGPLVAQARERVKAQVRQTGSLDRAERDRQSAARFEAEIIRLNVLDPAMGSGHFLVEATSYLARALATDDYVQAAPSPAAGEGRGGGESDLLYWKRRVVEACIYGVDKNPMAVELAKLSLWLKTASADKPLSFLDHHLRHGDSLIGAWLKDLQGAPAARHAPTAAGDQTPLFNESAFTLDAGLAVKGVAVIENLPTLDIDDVHAKEEAWRSIQESHIMRWRRLADLWVSAYFGNTLSAAEYRALAARLQGQESLMSAEQAAQFLSHPAVTDNDYFHWELAFPEVFFDEYGRSLGEAAGFDAVVGNPPYARIQILSKQATNYFSSVYTAGTGNYDLYVLFIERGLNLLNDRSLFGYIVPNKFFRVDYGLGIRKVLSAGHHVKTIIDFNTVQVFGETATTYTTLLFLKKAKQEKVIEYWSLQSHDPKTVSHLAESNDWTKAIFQNGDSGTETWNFHANESKTVMEKIENASVPLGSLALAIARGSSTGNDSVFVVNVIEEGFVQTEVKTQFEQTTLKLENDLLRTPIYATDFQKYRFQPSHNQKVIYPYSLSSNELLSEEVLQNSYPLIWDYLTRYKAVLSERAQYSKWYSYSAPRNLNTNDKADLLIPLLAYGPAFSRYPKPQSNYVLMASGGFGISFNVESIYSSFYLLALINSCLLFFYLRAISNVFRGGYITCTKQYFEKLPISEINFGTSEEERTDVLATFKSHYQQNNPRHPRPNYRRTRCQPQRHHPRSAGFPGRANDHPKQKQTNRSGSILA
ncbi:MAG: N-6 DNA methylase [Chloroflexi bacterium]|nr:N-6 DNA methylase [Chloroflexota bacterium]